MIALLCSMALAADDPRLWLEEVEGEQALDWVAARNQETVESLGADPELGELQARIRAILDADDRIPFVSKQGDYLYNFWRDGERPQGVWRRTTLASYATESPEWEELLDLDVLSEADGVRWVWHGAECLRPDYDRCLIALSRGGSDADITREFDVPTRSWVEGGFERPEAKGGLGWIDRDTVLVSTDFGEGSLTRSGYPRQVKVWRRGTPLSEAEPYFEGEVEDVGAGAWHDDTPGYERTFAYRSLTFFTNALYERDRKGRWIRIDKPDHVDASVHRDVILFTPREAWTVGDTTFPGGALLAADYERWKKGKRQLEVLFEPSERTSLSGWSWTRNHLLLGTLDNVRSRVEVLTPGKKGWARRAMADLPANGEVRAWAIDDEESDAYWLTVTDFLTPSTLWMGEIDGDAPRQLKQTRAWFDTSGLAVEQRTATSDDGTAIPYFVVGPDPLPTDGSSPTLLYGYGGFEASMTPRYSGSHGVGWLERGGVYVLANIRGGGEFGPRWHRAALRENRHRAYEDFAAVARDLVDDGVTTPERLGVMGGSNGGLLVGNMYTQYPELFGAVVCQVPLLDMKRYTKLLAGASWIDEYGDPDTDDWSFLKTFSPYHLVDPEEDHPPILLTTSTRDDRVHPGHARKMAHLLLEHGKEVVYYENVEGGHGGAANSEQRAFMWALAYSFLWDALAEDEVADEQ